MSPEQKKEVVVDSAVGAMKSKTVWFSALLAVTGAVEAHSAVLTSLIGEQKMGIVMMVVGLVTAILRSITTTSLSEK